MKTTTCLVCNTKLTRKNRPLGTEVDDMCTTCYDLAGIENEHSDGQHDEGPSADCPLCKAEFALDMTELALDAADLDDENDPDAPADTDDELSETEDEDEDATDIPVFATETSTFEETITAPVAGGSRYINHRDHGHPLTPAARAACRASIANGTGPIGAVLADDQVATWNRNGAKTVHIGVVSAIDPAHKAPACNPKLRINPEYTLGTASIDTVTCTNCRKRSA